VSRDWQGRGLDGGYGVVGERGGRIGAGNRKGGGAVFDIRLPVAAPDKPGVEEAA